ncbi:MAG: excinuclease ABC subunit UvrC [Planctomycetota bacterium]
MTPETRDALLEKVGLFPTGPGVYTFLDRKSKVIYVGKAKNLRARVRSYLRVEDDGRRFYRFLLDGLEDVQGFATHTEKEALLLENALIKRHKPKWNIKLTDDKSFLQILLTTNDRWPRTRLVRVTSRQAKRKGEVFGPYASSRAVRETLRHVKRYFPLRTCSDAELKNRTRPCIEHEMGRCVAPCVGLVTDERYGELVGEVRLFLKGKNETLLPRLRERMLEHSQALRYEQAGRVRDQIQAIERTLEQQRVAREGGGDRDVLGVAARDGLLVVQILQVRDGQLTEPRSHELRTLLAPEEGLNAFLGQYYHGERYVPEEVLLPFEVADQALLEEVLSERRGSRVRVTHAVRGQRRSQLELAQKNAALALATGEERHELTEEVLRGLQTQLQLARAPRSIECFDISTIQGQFQVASKVRFDDGQPAPQAYRTYRVRTVEGQDDFASMEEVIGRRLRSGLAQGDLPNLIVVDGGPSQLARALVAAREAGVDPGVVEFVGLAKARAERLPLAGRARGPKFERVHRPEGGEPIVLPPASLECRFLARVRDAAHRTAIRFHRELRRKSALRSGLEEVPGVGKKRREQLLKRFGSLRGIRAASLAELEEVVPAKVAASLQAFLSEPAADEAPAASE